MFGVVLTVRSYMDYQSGKGGNEYDRKNDFQMVLLFHLHLSIHRFDVAHAGPLRRYR